MNIFLYELSAESVSSELASLRNEAEENIENNISQFCLVLILHALQFLMMAKFKIEKRS